MNLLTLIFFLVQCLVRYIILISQIKNGIKYTKELKFINDKIKTINITNNDIFLDTLLI